MTKSARTRTAAKTARKASARGAPSDAVDAYIAACAPAVRAILERIRGIVRGVAPDADEVISYRMPAFRLDGGALLYYAAFKTHIGMFPPVQGDDALRASLEPYRGPKGNLRFPLDEPMPYPLIRRVVKARVAEHRAARQAKRR